VTSDKLAARWIGVLFIIGTVAGALSMIVTGSVLEGPAYLAKVSAQPNTVVAGALLVLVMGFALALVPVIFWPVGRRHGETLALGYVVFRGALESFTYLTGALGWLLLVALAKESGQDTLAGFVRTTEAVVWDQLIAIPFILGATMFYWLLYRSQLVPRWLSGWGLFGAALYIMVPVGDMLGASIGFLMGPLAIQEMVLAVWLIAKGFSPAQPQTPVDRA
jgi:hypothetical protein